MATIIKLTMNGTTRRFSEPSDGLDIERLISLAAKAFGVEGSDGHLSFVYVDEDGDAITATSNTELQEAVAVMTAMNDGKPKLQFKLLQGSAHSNAAPIAESAAFSESDSHLASEESKSIDVEAKKARKRSLACYL